LSLVEDAFVIGLSFITLKYPLIALAVSVVVMVLLLMVARSIWKWLTKREAEPLPTAE
jgi:hypothetical protein